VGITANKPSHATVPLNNEEGQTSLQSLPVSLFCVLSVWLQCVQFWMNSIGSSSARMTGTPAYWTGNVRTYQCICQKNIYYMSAELRCLCLRITIVFTYYYLLLLWDQGCDLWLGVGMKAEWCRTALN
jgi:hypothetical protein